MSIEAAILSALVQRADGRASRIEIRHEVEAFNSGGTDAGAFELACSDLANLGLLTLEGDEIGITEAGLSVFRAIEPPNELETSSSADIPRETLTAIDQLIGADARLKIFDLELRDQNDLEPEESNSEQSRQTPTFDSPEMTASERLAADAVEADGIEGDAMESDAMQGEPWPEVVERRQAGPMDALHEPTSSTGDVPSFLKQSVGAQSKVTLETQRRRSASRKTKRFKSIRSNVDRLAAIWRGHLAQPPAPFTKADRSSIAQGIMVAALSLLMIIVAVGGLLAVSQIQSLRTQIKRMQQTLAPIKTEVARLDSAETGRTVEQKDAPSPPPGRSVVAAAQNPPPSPKLELSQDETRLIKEYIKPAPATGQRAQPINVGDPVTVGTIPLPSPVTEKIPKLLGGRFTIHNGAIIILKRGSHQADAVLATN